MARLEAPCPSCAAPVEFKSRTSLVTICPYCQSVVARGDRKLEDHGRVSELVETQSPLKIGVRGRFRGKPFRLLGRTQYQHAAGGVWDEWYAQFPNGKWGWLAEAQGRFYMTFQKKVKEGSELPAIESLEAGATIQLGENEFTVAEVGEATASAAEGEIPFDFRPGTSHPFADLYGPDGQFASLDYGSEPAGYVGWQVSLEEIGLGELRAADEKTRRIAAKDVSCPQCGGSLKLQAPGETRRVACPYCSSLLDCDQGNLKYLETISTKVDPLIEIGSTGTLFEVEYSVIGFMQRSVTFDRKYFWTEYLLYNPTIGFRWLVHSDQHWSFTEPVSPAEVRDFKATAIWDGKTFKLFQRAIARVEYVLGEFYWQVKVGEEVTCRDLICPPRVMSIERSLTAPLPEMKGNSRRARMNLGEVNISIGTYLRHEEIERAFQLKKELPRSWKVAPNQPFPCDRGIFVQWAMFAIAMGVIYLGASAISSSADPWMLAWGLFLVSIIPVGAGIVNHSFDVKRWSDSDYSPYATDD